MDKKNTTRSHLLLPLFLVYYGFFVRIFAQMVPLQCAYVGVLVVVCAHLCA